jgi:hypothetical protein
MTRIVEHEWQSAGSGASRLGFEFEGWSRYLTLDGRRAFLIGGRCDTCEFLFERLDGANDKVEIEETTAALRTGVVSLSDPVVGRLASGLPEGEYLTCLLDVDVGLVRPGDPADYFAQEQIAVWGLDGFWGLPHHPKVPYYRAGVVDGIDERATLYQFVVPLFPDNWLDPSVVATYAERLEGAHHPTAVAIAVLDVRGPAWPRPGSTDHPRTHWCLAHYLLDGHHKLLAASRAGRPARLVSFLAADKGTSSRAQIERMMAQLAVCPNPG